MTPEARHRITQLKKLASEAKRQPPTHPASVRFLDKGTGDVEWLCDRLLKGKIGGGDEENKSLREDHEALKETLLAVCSRLDVERIDAILPAIDRLKLQATEPDEIDEEGYVTVEIVADDSLGEEEYDYEDDEDDED